MSILAGDVGGTKTALCIYSNKGDVLLKKRYHSKSYPSLYIIVKKFLFDYNGKISSACFGVAGPVMDGRCKTTNLPWTVDAAKLAKAANTRNIAIINDFEATGNAIHLMKEKKDLVRLNRAAPERRAVKAVLGAGTGLGEAVIHWDCEEGYTTISSEGGHCDFAPRTDVEWKLKKFLVKKYGYAEWESVLSGPGISNIYLFLTGKKKTPEEITASYNKDKKAKETVDMFVSFYAREASNLALKVKALGGLYIVGTIAHSLLPFLRKKSFVKTFIGKGKMKKLLKRMPVYVVTNEEIGLLGAASVARKLL